MRSVCVFCGSRPGSSPAYAAAAAAFGQGLAARGWRLVYGGGEVGLMGVVARAALAGGASVLGVIPGHLLEREAGKRDVTELAVTATMFERKERMLRESDAFVVLPGGFGTIDELLEVVTLKQLGQLGRRPILVVDVGGVWAALLAAFEDVVRRGFAGADALGLYEVLPDVAAALARLDRPGVADGGA